MRRPKVLWNGDACVSTGFARVTHKVLDVLRETYDVVVCGINYRGDPHDYPYKVYPAYLGGDSWGIGRMEELYRIEKPDLIVIQNDPWNVADYAEDLAKCPVPTVAFMPVDGLNIDGAKLNWLAAGIFYTQFALDEARKGGFTAPGYVVGLGVDRDIYRPVPRDAARVQLGLIGPPEHGRMRIPMDAFVVGNVNRNQGRKRIDLTIAYFAEWVHFAGLKNAYLYLHMAPTGDVGWNIPQLVRYYGIAGRVIYTSNTLKPGVGVDEEKLALAYNAFDVQISTTQGEGWGLCTLEGMACAIPQIVPDWSALGEWPKNAVHKVPCTSIATTPKCINTIGGVADRDATIAVLDQMYRDRDVRESYSQLGYERACQPEFTWRSVGEAFGKVLAEVPLKTTLVEA